MRRCRPARARLRALLTDSTVRLGQLSERVAVPGLRPGDQIGCYHFLSISSIDTGRAANFAEGAAPTFSAS